MEAFNSCKDTLLDGLKYHDQLSRLQEADANMRELIRIRRDEMEAEEIHSSDIPVEGPLRYVATEANDVMADFEDLLSHNDPEDVQDMIAQLNEDQLRVFEKVKNTIEAQLSAGASDDAELLRLFVSGCGGTGKSFLIKTVRAWVQATTGKNVVVAAPTGIAARNVNGLTIHGILMLPVEHGSTPPYRPMSDDALKIVREKLRNVTLFIVDEISMVSNVTLLYMHLRLTEIFQTEESEDGWFGRRNLLFLGDLLQLPPVFEGPVYNSVLSETSAKLTGSMGTVDLWRKLFTYDELTINMRQKEEKEFASMLSRFRLGYISDDDINVLGKCKISLSSDTMSGRMKEVVQVLAALPDDTVCLLPTRHMCHELNKEMLQNLPGKEIQLNATDTVDCPTYLRQKVSKKLVKCSEDSTLTAGLEKVLIIKIGSKVMLRRNIDVTRGLVNGVIGTVYSVKYSIDQANVIDSITIKFDDGKEHDLEKVNSKFQVLDKAFVIRRQFPISSAYAITIHKSQGLTLRNVLVDIGNNIFACGQAYVAMSCVTSLSGLHLINFDPRSIKALDSAIIEYTYLRKNFRPNLPLLTSHKKRPKSTPDQQWCATKFATLIQQHAADCAPFLVLPNKGFRDTDGSSSYANSVMQCLLHSKAIRNVFSDDSNDCLKQLVKYYESEVDTVLDCMDIRKELGIPFDQCTEQDPTDYIVALATKFPSLSSLLNHSIAIETLCEICKATTVNTKEQIVMNIQVPQDTKSMKMDELIISSQQYAIQETCLCNTCNVPMKLRTHIVNAKQVVVVKLDVWNTAANGDAVRRKASITSVQNSSIKVGDKLFTLRSSVHLLSKKSPGLSYISIVHSDNKWIHCNNQVLSSECWPKGAKNIYLAFYEHTPARGTKRHKFKPEVSKLAPFSTISTENTVSSKRKLPESCSHEGLDAKKSKAAVTSSVVTSCEDWGGITSVERPVTMRTEWRNYRYFPVDEEWQRYTCRLLNLRFIRPFQRASGGPDVILTLPDTSSLRHIGKDGNCLFRAMSFMITGSESQHFEIRSSIIAHMFSIPELVTGRGADGHTNYLTYYHGGYHSVEDYLTRTCMATNGTWGTDFEMCLLAHMVDAVVYSYKAREFWIACFPNGIDHDLPEDVNKKSLYIYYTGNHYDVVTSVLPSV